MPCGGIYPIKGSPIEKFASKGCRCFVCGKETDDLDLFCDEWDCTLHYDCIGQFLSGGEGNCVIVHQHDIIAYSRQNIDKMTNPEGDNDVS